jgi:phosphoribosyl 1,2-cyclic phosphodiesterase
MPFLVKFWGTRGSIPTPGAATQGYGGNTTCVEVRAGEVVLICDGGTGLRELGLDLQRRYGERPIVAHLFFSHPHWDHIQGFPFFAPAYDAKNELHIYGTDGADDRIFNLLSGQMRSDYFPVDFSELQARIVADHLPHGRGTIDGVAVRAEEQPHPGRSFAFSFEHQGKRVVFATDSELDLVLSSPDLPRRDPAALRALPESVVEFVRGADLLIADGQYNDAEYLEHEGWGHPRASTVVDLAVQAGVKKLALTHHDPMHADNDVETLVGECRARAAAHGTKLLVFGAREGLEIEI